MIFNLSLRIYPQAVKPVRFEHITADNGLSENAITTIIQDKQGFLWFGSHDGLNRYDGYNFQIYRNDPNNHLTISSNLIQSIFEDSDEVLWIGTFDKGLDRFDRGEKIFIHYRSDLKDPNSISNNHITTIYEDKNKTLWIGTAKGGLNKFDRKTQKFQHFLYHPKNSKSISNSHISSIFEDSHGVLWIGTHSGLNSFDREKGIFTNFKYDKKKTAISSDHILDIAEDQFGYLWIATDNGLNRFDRKKGFFVCFLNDPADLSTISSNDLSSIYIDKNGLIWVGLWGVGFDIFNPENNVFNHFKHNPNESNSLSHNKVTQIFMDRSDIIWIATEGGGLDKFNKSKMLFANYHHELLNTNSLSQNNVTRIYEAPSGILWIGTDGQGLNRFDRKAEKFKLFLHNPDDPRSISSNYIKSICEDRFGFLWIGTMGGGLNKYDKSTKSFTRYKYNPKDRNGIPNNIVTDIIEDSNGILWFGCDDAITGLCRYDRDRKIFISYSHDPKNPKSISNNLIIEIFEDKNKILWCGGANGLNRFNREDESFTNYFHDPNNRFSLSHNWVWSIFEDNKDRLWIGTYGGGLNLFDRRNGSFIHYTDKDGLANNVIYGILDDKEGNLWMSTNKGISKFDPETKRFKNYDKGDGLQGNEFNTGSYCQGKDGRLYFGGTNGLTAFYPEKIKDNPHIPSIVITSFKVFNREMKLPYPISKTKEISLKYDQNFISFEFASLDYSIPSKNKYAFTMEGVDKDWIYTGSEKRFVNYTDLSPGNYIFRVKGSNNDGIWNEKGVWVNISISPPFWKRWWFTTLWIVLAGIIIFIIISFIYRHIVLLKEKAQADRFAAIGKYASFIAHDIKSPLEGIYLIVNEIKKMFPKNDEKQEYMDDVVGGINQIRSMIKRALDFSLINKPKLEMSDLNIMLKNFSTEFQKSNKCTFNLKLDKNLPLIPLDFSLIKRVFLNLFLNSYQAREEECKITIKSKIKKKDVLVYINDNGKGILKSQLPVIFEPFVSSKEDGHGIGLAFVFEVIKNHKGYIQVKSKPGKETTFIISLPIIKKIEER